MLLMILLLIDLTTLTNCDLMLFRSGFVTLRANFVNILFLNKENPEKPLMAGQPADHLQVAPPFSKLRMDFFEPFKVKQLRKLKK